MTSCEVLNSFDYPKKLFSTSKSKFMSFSPESLIKAILTFRKLKLNCRVHPYVQNPLLL